MRIANHEIGKNSNPYFIAEMSGNHMNSLNSAIELLEKCSIAGASAFKLQTYTPDSMTLNSRRRDFVVEAGPWKGRNLYELYSQGATPNEWLPTLFDKGRELGITVFSTPFAIKDVELLENLNVPAYKVASFEITFHQLLKEVALTGKPVIISTGMATTLEIAEAIQILRENGCKDLAILKCTTSYPAKVTELNLQTIKYLSEKFDCPIGFSDHTEGLVASVAAVALGACIIEKHIKLDRDLSSVDSSFSLPVSNLSSLIHDLNQAFQSIGTISTGPETTELPFLKYRRSIIATKDIKAGEIMDRSNLAILRPAIGLRPTEFENLIGKIARINIAPGEGIKIEHIE